MKRLHLYIGVLSATMAMGLLASAASATNFVTNGDFQTGDLTNWWSAGAGVDVVANSGPAGSGDYSLHITGGDWSSMAAPLPLPLGGYVYGTTYTISFDLKTDVTASNKESYVGATGAWGGNYPAYTIVQNDPLLSDGLWHHVSWSFVGDIGALTPVISTGGGGGPRSIFIDNFSVSDAPPEPKWIGATGNWGTAANWATGTIPNGQDATALLTESITQPEYITVREHITLGTLTLGNANAYTLVGNIGTSLLTMSSASTAAINVTNGSHQISVPLHLASDTTLNVANLADTLTITSPLTVDSGLTITKSGLGVVDIRADQTYSGSGATLNVDAGTVNFKVNPGTGLTVNPNGGNVNFTAAGLQQLAGLNVLSAASTVQVGSNALLTVASLNLSSGSSVNNAGSLTATAGSSTADSTVMNTGTFTVTGNVATGLVSGAGSTVVTGNLTASTIRQNTLTIGNSASVTLQESPGTLASGWPSGTNSAASIIHSLGLGTNAKFDLTNNDLIIDWSSSGTNPYAAIAALVRTGYNGGAWNGNGIISSDARVRNIFTLLVLDNANLGSPLTSFDDMAIATDSVIIKFTHQSDLNGDGVVTAADATLFSADYAAYNVDTGTNRGAPVTHAQGDMDFDGQLTFNDAMLFTNFYNDGLAHLPEPTSLAFLAFGAAGLLARKRR